MDDIGQWIKAARLHAKLSQEALAARVRVSKGNVSHWELGRHKPGLDHLLLIAKATGFPLPAQLAGFNVAPAQIGTRRIPLLSYVQAGNWSGSTASADRVDSDDWLMTDLYLSPTAFALEIRGDSMLPEFRPGDRVIIDPAVSPQPGDYVVAKNGDEEATFKKYRPRSVDAAGNVVFELVPLNEDYPSMRSDQLPIRIIGVMIEHRKYRRRGKRNTPTAC